MDDPEGTRVSEALPAQVYGVPPMTSLDPTLPAPLDAITSKDGFLRRAGLGGELRSLYAERLGRLDEAESAVRRGLELKDFSEGWAQLSHVLTLRGKEGEAAISRQKALTFSSTHR
jgi:hypothetical protein